MVKRPAALSDSDSEGDQASKRARTTDLSDDEGYENGTQGRSTQRKGKGKARAQDDNEGEGNQQGPRAAAVDADQEEIDAHFERENAEKLFQIIIRSEGTSQKGISEYGIIEAVHMVDFMCHEKLSFEFGPQINFIIGHNGSGKSAVLTALVIALGGKTAATGRGTGLKTFIREGRPWAEVTVKIKNQGSDAYKHDQYGNSIIITRRFTKDGSATWKIMSEHGKVISNKKDELSKICDHMNIQVDNPMNVLTQDSSRQFLSSSSSGDKYMFFLRGTQLFQLAEDYDECLENISKTYKLLQEKLKAIPDLKAKFEQSKRKYQEAEKAREHKQRLEDLKKELAWSHVAGKGKELTEKKMEIARLKSKIPKIQEKLTEAETEHSEWEARIKELEAEVDALGDQDLLAGRKANLTQEIKQNSSKLLGYSKDMKRMDEEIKTLNRKISENQAKLEEENAKLLANTQAQRDALDAEIQSVQEDIAKYERQLEEITQEKRDLDTKKRECQQKGHDLEKEKRELQNAIMSCDNLIRDAQRMAADKYVPYGHNIKDICQRIQGMNWYGDVPLGPLGLYVRAKDPARWGKLLRIQLGGFLMSFVITDARDRPQLSKLLKDYNNHNQIIISQKDIFDYSSGEPDQKYLTVLRALEISEPFVTRVLINQAAIERVVLNPERKALENQLLEIGGQQSGWSADLFTVRTYGQDGIVTNPIQDRRSNSLLLTGRDNASEIRHHEDERRRLEEKLRAKDQEMLGYKNQFGQAMKSLQELNKSETNIKDLRVRAQNKLASLQSEISTDFPSIIHHLKATIEEAESEKATLKQNFEEVMKNKAEVDEQQQGLQTQMNEVKQKLEEYAAKKAEYGEKISLAAIERVKKQQAAKHYGKKLEEAKEEVRQAEEQGDVLEQEYQNWTEAALKFCEEWPEPRSTEEVQRNIDSTKAALQEREKRQGASIDELAAQLAKDKDTLEKAQNDLQGLYDLNNALKSSMEARTHRWHEFRRHIALRTKLIFQYNLSRRGYYGKVIFKHSDQTLQLRVQTDDQAVQGSAEKDPKVLSGGEKSFSTICLLLSLWNAIGCPLRCLDEFDVFMDAVNRRISMKMMIETASASPDKQYILITPQDMTNIHIGSNVKVHRMQDPDRRQGRLRFGAAPSND
ncbi:hypothetical protein CC2G_012466 [Coprinopsis cinerea AmutBmut pab1-1]|nr:hypothetical protein CC2G_012466 [Coprinopsis cinerea AmutBmut pab1-1]